MRTTVIARVFMLTVCGLVLSSCAGTFNLPPVQTFQFVDLDRYTGLWYEIARTPNNFQDGCINSTALYSIQTDGDLSVINRCRFGKNGRMTEVSGRAWVVEPATNARLKVSFFWPFRGDYWIIELGQGYEYSVVGTPDRRFVWILSRSPRMERAVYDGILKRLEQQGFEPGRLVLTPREQPE